MKKCNQIEERLNEAAAAITPSPSEQAADALNNALKQQLTTDENQKLQAHLEQCDSCSTHYRQTIALFQHLNQRRRPQMDNGFWDTYYQRLETRMDEEETTEKVPIKEMPGKLKHSWNQKLNKWGMSLQKLILIPTAAAIILVVGIGLGNYLSSPQGQNDLNGTLNIFQTETREADQSTTNNNLSPALASHFDNVQPLLTDLSNSTPTPQHASLKTTQREKNIPPDNSVTDNSVTDNNTDNAIADKETINRLLQENQILKQLVARQNNMSVKEVMDDLELILVELNNSNGNSPETNAALRELIKENSLLFKMRTINTRKQTNSPISGREI